MKQLLVLFAMVLAIGLPAKGDHARFTIDWAYVLETTQEEANPGVEVRVRVSESAAAAYIIRLEFVTESNRVMRFSKLIEFKDRYKANVSIVHAFDTGIGRVTRVTVEELRAIDFMSVDYSK